MNIYVHVCEVYSLIYDISASLHSTTPVAIRTGHPFYYITLVIFIRVFMCIICGTYIYIWKHQCIKAYKLIYKLLHVERIDIKSLMHWRHFALPLRRKAKQNPIPYLYAQNIIKIYIFTYFNCSVL